MSSKVDEIGGTESSNVAYFIKVLPKLKEQQKQAGKPKPLKLTLD